MQMLDRLVFTATFHHLFQLNGGEKGNILWLKWWFLNHSLSINRKFLYLDETNISTVKHSTQAQTRFPSQNGYKSRSKDSRWSSSTRPSKADSSLRQIGSHDGPRPSWQFSKISPYSSQFWFSEPQRKRWTISQRLFIGKLAIITIKLIL